MPRSPSATPGPSYRSPKEFGAFTHLVHVYVPDVDAHYAQAVEAGAPNSRRARRTCRTATAATTPKTSRGTAGRSHGGCVKWRRRSGGRFEPARARGRPSARARCRAGRNAHEGRVALARAAVVAEHFLVREHVVGDDEAAGIHRASGRRRSSARTRLSWHRGRRRRRCPRGPRASRARRPRSARPTRPGLQSAMFPRHSAATSGSRSSETHAATQVAAPRPRARSVECPRPAPTSSTSQSVWGADEREEEAARRRLDRNGRRADLLGLEARERPRGPARRALASWVFANHDASRVRLGLLDHRKAIVLRDDLLDRVVGVAGTGWRSGVGSRRTCSYSATVRLTGSVHSASPHSQMYSDSSSVSSSFTCLMRSFTSRKRASFRATRSSRDMA